MLITLCALIVSLFMLFFIPVPTDFSSMNLVILFLAGGTSIFFSSIFLNVYVLAPLGYLEQRLIPNLMNLVHRDFPLRLGRLYLFLFTLVSYLCVALITRIQDTSYYNFFLIWILFFGLALDVLRDCWSRYVNYLDPTFITKKIVDRAENAIRDDNRSELLKDLDSLAEIATRSVESSKLALSSQTLQSFPPLVKNYFDSTKSISHATAGLQGNDSSSYIVFFLLQRLELINDKALRDRQEVVCRQMVVSLGKIIVYCAKFDLSLVAFPTHFLTKFGLKAQQHYFGEVTMLTTSTLSEIGKAILTEIDLTYLELQDAFQAIINGLAAIARETFKKHKDADLRVLIQPLSDLKGIFKSEKLVNHKDSSAIIHQIDNVLEEFSILEQVMQTLPTIDEDESAEGNRTAS